MRYTFTNRTDLITASSSPSSKMYSNPRPSSKPQSTTLPSEIRRPRPLKIHHKHWPGLGDREPTVNPTIPLNLSLVFTLDNIFPPTGSRWPFEQPSLSVKIQEDYRREVAEDLFHACLNARLSKTAMRDRPPFLTASSRQATGSGAVVEG